jgi:hypothetical protein
MKNQFAHIGSAQMAACWRGSGLVARGQDEKQKKDGKRSHCLIFFWLITMNKNIVQSLTTAKIITLCFISLGQ